MRSQRVEDLIAYQLARELKLQVYNLLRCAPAAASDFSFRDQIRRSSSRSEACIAEGHAREKPGEFVQFLRYALASVKETEMWLKDGVDRGHYQRALVEDGIVLAPRSHAAIRKLAERISRPPRQSG